MYRSPSPRANYEFKVGVRVRLIAPLDSNYPNIHVGDDGVIDSACLILEPDHTCWRISFDDHKHQLVHVFENHLEPLTTEQK